MAKSDNYLSFDDYMHETLQNTDEAIGFLDAALEEYMIDGDAKYLLSAIKRVAESQGGVGKLAKETNLNRQNLYKIFNNKISPRFNTLLKILNALGYSISIKKMEPTKNV